MNPPSKQTRNQFIAAILIIIIVLVIWFLLWPQYQSYKNIGIELEEVEKKMITQQSILEKIDQLIESYNESSEKYEVLQKALPVSPSVPKLITSLEQMTVKSGLLLGKLQVTEVIDPNANTVISSGEEVEEEPSEKIFTKPKIVTIKVDMAVEGSPEAFVGLLDALEKNLRILDVQILDIQAEEGLNTQLFDMVIETYYQKS